MKAGPRKIQESPAGERRGARLTVLGRGRWLTAVLCAALGGIGCGLSGCGDGQAGGVKRLAPRGTPFLSGITVPAGFELEDRNSEDYQSGEQRWARHWYLGSADVQAVRTFYLDQMPLLGWSKVSDHTVKGTVSIRFEKRTESCVVEISSAGMFNRCRVQVIVMPFSRTPAPTEPPRRMAP